ncbi:probable serine/threonine-protein kinase SIS8 isoform X2 [Typha latifolia]|uniref:probable serine/threonine-protein kinase SIS8 isoform X2 n=1 Tax=Typha latifolia TaxID=4733 RepID=UPI003C2E2D40
MSRMKHLLRKLHIGGGGGAAAADHHHHRISDSRANPSPSAPSPSPSPSPSTVTSSSSSAAAESSRGRAQQSTEVRPEGASGGIGDGGGGGGDFSLFEEEYQVQLALAISASDPDGLEDPDSVQMKAAKRMSLGCSTTVGGGGGRGGVGGVGDGGGGGEDDATLMEFLSLRYWNYNVVNYDEKLMDGFYDVYGIVSNSGLQGRMPLLVDLQAISVSENITYEVVLVNRTIDPALQQLEKTAIAIALEHKREHGLVAIGLVQKLADLVVNTMGGPVEDAEDMLSRWTLRSYELHKLLNSVVLPLGSLEVGLSRHRALLFKVLADRVSLPCKLVKGSYYTGTDEGAVNLIKLDYDSEYIVDLMGAPGTLIPAENPSTPLQNSDNYQVNSDIIEESVKELCLALDRISNQFEKENETSEGTSDNSTAGLVSLQLQEVSRKDPSQVGDGANILEENKNEIFENENGKLLLPAHRSPDELSGTKEVISPAQQMKVNDVSKYVVTAAMNPEFAQKLHAVLLESGASPPLDLFSDLNTSQGSYNQNEMERSTFAEEREGKREFSDDYSSSHFQPTNNLYSESSRRADNEKRPKFFVEDVTYMQGHKSKVSSDVGTSSPIVTNELTEVHCAQAKGPLNDSQAEGTPLLNHELLSGILCWKQVNVSSVPYETRSGQRGHVGNINSDGMLCSQMNKEVLLSNSSQHGGVSFKEHLEDVKDSAVGLLRNDNKDMSGHVNETNNSVIDGVVEWEIRWEDLQIGERIGLGSYGEVYKADWHGTEVAVKKFLDQDLSGDALEQFRCEFWLMQVKIMLRLRHPNVVLFMGAVTRPPNLSILTEFLPRGSLYRLLHRPNVQLDEKRRLKMALDVAKGMNYLHTSHPTIVHRDLKTPNLLVDKNWVVKVCDFGLSRLQHHTFLSSKSTAGTPEWMAPEVLRNEPSNEKCDVYSFGVILWELATLRMPWSGLNPMQVVGAVGFQNRRLDIPKEVDPMVAKIISDCWESEPNKRPSFAQLMSPLKQLQHLVVSIS